MVSFRWTELLDKEAQLLAKMIVLEEKTTPLLLEGEGSAGELQSLNFSKEGLIIQMQELERQRQEATPPGLTLQAYITKEKPGDARELEALRTRLRKLQISLRRRQKINNYLLQSNLSFVEHVLGIFSKAGDRSLYAAGGEVQEKGRGSFPAAVLDDQA